MLLHPLGADRTVWDPVVELLADERQTIAVDLPGFGASAPLTGDAPPLPRRLAAAVAGALADEGVHGYAVAGCSLGGWVALELGLTGAGRSVTAIAPAGLWPEPLRARRDSARTVARIASPLLGGLLRSRALRRALLAQFVAHPERVERERAAALVRAYAHAPGLRAVNDAMRANRFTGLADLHVPTTLAWPDRDRLVARPRSLPPTVDSVVLRGCGHLAMWDDPDQVAMLLAARSAP